MAACGGQSRVVTDPRGDLPRSGWGSLPHGEGIRTQHTAKPQFERRLNSYTAISLNYTIAKHTAKKDDPIVKGHPFFLCGKNSLLTQALRQAHGSLSEVGDILLHVDRIPHGTDAIHVTQTCFLSIDGDRLCPSRVDKEGGM